MDADPYMARALDEARKAAKRGEVPVGAVVVLAEENRIIAAEGNRVEELSDPTAHAEMLVLRNASKVMTASRLTDCDLYVTLEPCSMCATAVSLARIRRLYYGAPDPKGGGVYHGPQIFAQPTCHHRPEVYGGIGETEASGLLKVFFQSKR